MSFKELRERDIPRNEKLARALGQQGAMPPAVAEYLATTVWPFLSGLLEEVEELDAAVDDLIEESDDILHGEASATISAPLVLGYGLVDELVQRMTLFPQPADEDIRKKIAAYHEVFAAATKLIGEITVSDDFDEDDDDGAEDDAEGDE